MDNKLTPSVIQERIKNTPLQLDKLSRDEQTFYHLLTELFNALRVPPSFAVKVMSAIIADVSTVLGESKH